MPGATAEEQERETVDLLVVGGGVNGCGIARDAAGRGLSVMLCEKGDLAQATSSASTKLFHGGLRYLEHYAFRLVRESLIERERLLRAMPHISWPMRFVLPHHDGLRPRWLIRIGLFIYDNLGGRRILPPTRTLDLASDPAGAPLKPEFRVAYEYSDCWVDDARLVALNARDAEARGARVLTRTRLAEARREGGLWRARLEGEGGARTVRARALVNAAGPWVDQVLRSAMGRNTRAQVRLVRGSHIVVSRLFEHDRAYIFQNADGRIVFAIPYETDFTLIGTTDEDHKGDPQDAACSEEEADYLRRAASEYFAQPIGPEQIVWRYSGVRPLFDDGKGAAAKATRDYRLDYEDDGAPLLSVFGGKITTYRRLAEEAVDRLARRFPAAGPSWTAGASLPGGGFAHDAVGERIAALRSAYPFLDEAWARRLFRAYGTEAWEMLGDAAGAADLGDRFGATLTEREADWLFLREWARSAEDILWRRSKLGLRFTEAEARALEEWCAERRTAEAAARSEALA